MSPTDMVVFFLEIALMLFTALVFGQVVRKFRLPAVLGELVGGIILGPTIFGWLSPGSYNWLFPASGTVFLGRDALVQICLLFFLFAAGLQMDLGLIKKRGSSIAWTSLLGIAIPFAFGFALVMLFPALWGEDVHGGLTLFALFMGTALSISALPVIARILMDLDLMKSEIGMIVMGSATVNDLIGWSMFALVLSNFAPDGLLGLPPYLTFILVLVLFVAMLTIGRTAGQKAQKWLQVHLPWPGGIMGLAMVFVLLLAAIAEIIGIHAVFGAFLVGVALSQSIVERDEAHDMTYRFVMWFFAPIYFVSIGLQADFLRSFDPVLVFMVLVVACAGKVLGASLGAWIGKLPFRQAVAVGFAMNARGAMEIVLATVAKNAGLIDDRIFVALVIMAIVTSVLSGPVLDRLCRSERCGPGAPAHRSNPGEGVPGEDTAT